VAPALTRPLALAEGTWNGSPDDLRRQAETAVLCDLVDGLIAEDLFGFRSRARIDASTRWERYLPRAEGEVHARVALGREAVVFRVHRAPALQPYRLSRSPVLLSGPEATVPVPLSPRALLDLLASRLAPTPPVNLAEVLDALEMAAVQGTMLLMTAPDVRRGLSSAQPTLVAWERLTALGDRPFHPTARAKQGWDDVDYARYTSAATQPFGLDWVAVRRHHLACGRPGEPPPAETVLGPVDRRALAAAATAAGVSGDDYLVLPVHPWQHRHVLRSQFADEWRTGACVPVAADLGSFVPTSSVRSLVPASSPGSSPARGLAHLKLPLGIAALGALRLLPARYLGNGARAQALLQEAADHHPLLGTRLHVCDEQAWWAFSAPGFEDRPGHLACMVRTYPPALTGEPGRSLVPLGALGVVTPDGSAPGLSRLLVDRDADPSCPEAALEMFGEVCRAVTEVALACFAHGLMPELHGQNALLAIHAGRVDGVVLRDHDTVRIHLPWLEQAGMTDPGYVVKPGTPNTLVASTPEELLSWFQTLAVQVALYAVGCAVTRAFGVDERAIWRELADGLRAGMAGLGLPPGVASVAHRQLFEAGSWPTKLLLGPLLTRRGTGGGSMPSGVGVTGNPVRHGSRADELARAGTIERLLNTYLRESGARPPVEHEAGDGTVTIPFPLTGQSVVGSATVLSASGHHRFRPDFWVRSDEGRGPGGRPLSGPDDVARLVARELAAGDPDPAQSVARQEALRAQVADSTTKTRHYLERRLAEGAPSPLDAPCPFLAAEQGLLLGHPFHPAAKASEGFDGDDLERYAPELRASFPLHWLAALPELVREERLGDDRALDPRPDVTQAAAARLGDDRSTWPLLPCHPWQAGHLGRLPAFVALLATGKLVMLGPLGAAVHPTSSVRTVWDPSAGRFLKLPLSVRITNFVRVNPPDQLRRSVDVSRVVASLGDLGEALELPSPSFSVFLELGYRTLVSPSLCAATGVVYREAPALEGEASPMVVAALLERSPHDGVPPLIRAVERAGRRTLHVRAWLARYLEISLLPLTRLAVRGISLEAHTQNSLVSLDGGWPSHFWVRDLEGASISRSHEAAGGGYGGLIGDDSPALYPEAEAWRRFGYYVLVNHVGQLVATLAEHLGPSESDLWAVVGQTLSGEAERLGPDPACAPLRRLLGGPELPAKANLRSRFRQHSEDPLYVGIPNPLVSGRSSGRSP
jgi:staphyloferrin B synthase